MNRYALTFRRLVAWLAELRLPALGVLPVALSFVIAYCLQFTEPALRLCGLALQLLGIGTVIWGIEKTRRHFGLPPLTTRAGAWLRRFPLIKRAAYLQPEGITVSSRIVGARLTKVFTATPDAPLDARLARIEQGLDLLQRRVGEAESQIDREASATEGKLRAEARARQQAQAELNRAIESASTGGLHISAIGAFWLFAGVVLGSASPEIAAWLGAAEAP